MPPRVSEADLARRQRFATELRSFMERSGLSQQDALGPLAVRKSAMSDLLAGDAPIPKRPRLVSLLAAAAKRAAAEGQLVTLEEANDVLAAAGFAPLAPDEAPGAFAYYEAARGQRLAGLAREMRRLGDDVAPPPATSEPHAGPPAPTAPRRRPVARRGLVSAAIAGVLVLFAGAFLASRSLVPQAARVGGLWVEPEHEQVVSGPFRFAARAYPAERTDPPVSAVTFTVKLPGRAGPWLVACELRAPAYENVYECFWDPAIARAPHGRLEVSFDVYVDAPTPTVLKAPHGVRAVTYQPTRQAVTGRIEAPADGAAVADEHVAVSGSVDGLDGASRLWTMVHQDGLFWPQRQALVLGGSWRSQARLGASPEDRGRAFDVVLVAVDPATDRAFTRWLQEGDAAQEYRPFRGLPPGASVLDVARVRRQ